MVKIKASQDRIKYAIQNNFSIKTTQTKLYLVHLCILIRNGLCRRISDRCNIYKSVKLSVNNLSDENKKVKTISSPTTMIELTNMIKMRAMETTGFRQT